MDDPLWLDDAFVAPQRDPTPSGSPDRLTESPNHYETAGARVAAMYQIPASVIRPRILELHVGPNRRVDADWLSERVVSCHLVDDTGGEDCRNRSTGSNPEYVIGLDQDLPFPSSSFDLVVLHYTLDELAAIRPKEAASTVSVQLLRRATAVLETGGVVTGCTGNASILRRLRGRQRPLMDSGGVREPIFSPMACARALGRAGLSNAAVYNVLPIADDPRNLVSMDARASRRIFRQQLVINRDGFSPARYLVRRVMMELALNRFIEPDLFFFGYRTC